MTKEQQIASALACLPCVVRVNSEKLAASREWGMECNETTRKETGLKAFEYLLYLQYSCDVSNVLLKEILGFTTKNCNPKTKYCASC